jgi:hypothetical protein
LTHSIIRDNAENLIDLCGKTLKIQSSQNYQSKWDYSPVLTDKNNGYVGLENLGMRK